MAESILIIGGGSDIAQQLARKLTHNDYKVTMLVRTNESVDDEIAGKVTIVNGDALSSTDLASAIEIAAQQGDGKISFNRGIGIIHRLHANGIGGCIALVIKY